eukprot:3931725-Prymnesium_polylepis.2
MFVCDGSHGLESCQDAAAPTDGFGCDAGGARGEFMRCKGGSAPARGHDVARWRGKLRSRMRGCRDVLKHIFASARAHAMCSSKLQDTTQKEHAKANERGPCP